VRGNFIYKIPKDLNLNHLIELEVIAIQVDQYNVLIKLHSSQNDYINISDSAPWELLDKEGKTIDQQLDFDSRDIFKIHKLLGSKIHSYKVESPTCLAFMFDSELILNIHDDSDQYESFTISPNFIF
jgi:hypothetical protein